MTKQDLERIKSEGIARKPKSWIRVGYSTCGVAAGAKDVYDVLVAEAKTRGLDLSIKKCGCVGLCSAEPMVEVNIDGVPRVFYGKVNKEVAHKIMDEHVMQKRLVDGHIYEL